jgi:hypothetical protein
MFEAVVSQKLRLGVLIIIEIEVERTTIASESNPLGKRLLGNRSGYS